MKGDRLAHSPGHWMVLALALSLGAAVSLGVTRFSYGLLLPAMRADLAWSYALAGAMNTANALGYFLGALAAPWMMRRWGPSSLLWVGALFASFFMVLSGFFTETEPLLLQRLMAGIASAAVFVAGGLLAARLGAQDPPRSALLLGIYYGGTGLGIVVSSGVVFWVLDVTALQAHGWRWAWWCLGALCLLAGVVLRWPARAMAGADGVPASAGPARADRFHWRQFGFGLSAYAFFGVGYIGYMTFVVALLRTQGRSALEAACFYALLGAAVMVSGRLWAGLLERHRDGRPLAVLNGLLGMATILPAWTQAWPLVLLSGALFGAVFLSVVASTTALVRHNLAQSAWVSGIGAFTAVFALGQIVGPTVVGWIADGAGGLERGLWCSAMALWAGALLATRQRSLVA